MTTTTFIISLLTAVAFGQSILSALVLAPRIRKSAIYLYLPLALFFVANALTEVGSMTSAATFAGIDIRVSGLAAFSSIPMHCTLAPLFWLYVRALTSEDRPSWSRYDIAHFMLAILSLLLLIIAWAMPAQEFTNLFKASSIENPRTAFQGSLILSTKVIDILVQLQTGFYIVLIIRRLSSYRARLMQLFASTEHLELRWFNWLAVFMFAYLALSLISFLADTLFESPHSLDIWESLIDVGLITTLAVWSLRQKPGLAIETQAIEIETKQLQSKDQTKYQNSGLSAKHRTAVADKIQRAMSSDKVYRHDNLSLSVLAKHIGELPSYVTQTLNIEIGESFFDYVNNWRIDEASIALIESDQTVLDIAINAGFNSRSSFYKAFKKIKGSTPTAYRKSQQ